MVIRFILDEITPKFLNFLVGCEIAYTIYWQQYNIDTILHAYCIVKRERCISNRINSNE